MACNFCTTTIDSYNPLKVTIQRSGANVLLYMQNQSRNIINIQRALLCLDYGAGFSTILYLRPNFAIQPLNRAWIEQGSTVLQYTLVSTAVKAQSEVEYTEVDGRSVSCEYNL
jgi:hypothetical protein